MSGTREAVLRGSRPGRARARLVGDGIVAFVLLVVLGATWALAVPLFAGPDEPSHLRRSAAVVRGQLRDVPHARPEYATVDVPDEFANAGDCFHSDPTVDASCLVFEDGDDEVAIGHTARNYPPLYHALVGAPSLVLEGRPAIYAMRLAGVVAAAALVTLAGTAVVRSRSPGPALLGLGTALTPMALFSMAVVNPSGMAVAAGIAAWCWGYHLVRRAPLARLGPAAAGLGVALCTLLLLRRDSLLWTACVLAALAALAPPGRRGALLRARAVHLLAVAVAAAAAVQVVVTRQAAATFAERSGDASVDVGPAWALRELADKYRHMLGVLGWLDTEIPLLARGAVTLVLVGLVAWALASAPRRVRVVLAGVVAAVAGAVLVFGAVRPDYVQGRYLLPLAVGVPLVAGLGLGEARRRMPPALLAGALGALALAQVVAFWACLRRYAIGVDGPWWFPPDAGWDPPYGSAVVLGAVNVVAVALLVGLALRRTRGSTRSPASTARPAA